MIISMMERIERECVRVGRLVGEMLALSRLQAGVDNHLSEEFDVHELLADVVEDAQFEATTKERWISVKSEVHGTIRGNVDLLPRTRRLQRPPRSSGRSPQQRCHPRLSGSPSRESVAVPESLRDA